MFRPDIDNFQIVSFVGTAFVTQTVPADSRGLELEGAWAATDRLVLSVSATYAEAEQKDTSERLPYSPKLATSFNARYEYPWYSAALVWRVDGAVNYRDKQYMGRFERNEDGALTLVDLRIALAAAELRRSTAITLSCTCCSSRAIGA